MPNDKITDEAIRQEWFEKQKKNDDYIGEFRQVEKFAGPKLELFGDFPGGKALESIDIDVNEAAGISSELIQLVTLGAYIDKESLDRTKTGGEIGATEYFFMNVLMGQSSSSHSGGRDEDFQMLMYDSRKQAKKALEDYAVNKDRTQIDRYLKNIYEYILDHGLEHAVSMASSGLNFAGFFDLIARAKDEFKNPPLPASALSKINEQLEIHKANIEAHEAKKELAYNFPAAKSPERERLVVKIIKAVLMRELSKAFGMEAMSETKAEAEKKLTSDEYIKNTLLPAMQKKNKNVVWNDGVKNTWATYLMIGSETGLTAVQPFLGTYQISALENPQKQTKYYERLEYLIRETDIYKKLTEIESFGELSREIDSLANWELKNFKITENVNGKTVTRNLETSDIYAPAEEKENAAKPDENTKKKYLEAFEKNAVARFIYLFPEEEAPENDLQGKDLLLQQTIMDYIRENNLPVDQGVFYTYGRYEAGALYAVCEQAVKENTPIFVKNLNGGVTRFTAKLNENGFEVASEELAGIPYRKYDIITEKYINRVNAEFAEKDAQAQGKTGFTEGYRKLDAYLKVMSGAAGEAQMPETYGVLLNAMEKLSKAMDEEYKAGGELKKSDRVEKLYAECAKALSDYLYVNPFDACAVNVNRMLARDMELLRGIGRDNALKVPGEPAREVSPQNKAAGTASVPRWLKDLPEIDLSAGKTIERHAGSVPNMTAYPEGAERFNQTKIDTNPEAGITEPVLQAVTLGAYMDDFFSDRQDYAGEGIDPGEYLFSNVLTNNHNSRDVSMHMMMFEGRTNADLAIKNYNRNPKILEGYVNNFVKYVCEQSLNMEVSLTSGGQIMASLFKLVLDVADTPVFKGKFPEAVLNKCRENVEIQKQMLKGYEAERKLASNVPPAASPERRELLLDIITANILSKAGGAYTEHITEMLDYMDDFQDVDEKNFAYIRANAEDKKKIELQHMTSQAYYDENVLPIVKKYLPDNYEKITGGNMKIIWEASGVAQGLMMGKMYIARSGYTYQTEMLKDPETREKYYKRIREMVESSDIFRQMMDLTPENGEKIQKLLEQVKADFTAIKPASVKMVDGNVVKAEKAFSVEDIPVTVEEKNILAQKKQEETAKLPERVKETKKLINHFFESNLPKARDEFINPDKVKLGKEIRSALDAYIKENSLNVDKDRIYTENAKEPKDYGEACYLVAKNDIPIYISKKDGGVYKISVTAGEKITINSEAMAAIPYNTLDYVKSRYINTRNLEIAQKSLREDRYEYLESYRKLKAYYTVMEEAAKNVEAKSAIYTDVVASLKKLDGMLTKLYEKTEEADDLGAVTDICHKAGAKEFKALDDVFAECVERIEGFFIYNPYDKLVNDLRTVLAADRKLVAAYVTENLKENQTASLSQVVLTERDKKQRAEHPEFRENHKNNAYLEETYKNMSHRYGGDANPLSGAMDTQFMLNKLGEDFVLDSNGGYVKNAAGSYLKTDGEWFTLAMQADFFVENYDELREFKKKNYRDYRTVHTGMQYDPKEVKELMKGKEKLLVPEAEWALRKAASVKFEKQYFNIVSKYEEEWLIAKGGIPDLAQREVSKFIDLSGTEEARKNNREFISKLLSGNRKQKREAFEQILDKCTNLVDEMKDYSPDDENLLKDERTAEKIIHFSIKAGEIQQVFKDAVEAGVNVYDGKYEKLRRAVATMENLSFLWGRRMEIMMYPAYDFLDLTKFKNVKPETIKKLADDTEDCLQLAEGLDKIKIYNTDAGKKNWLARTNKKKTFEDCVKAAPKLFATLECLDRTDKELVSFREKLVSNVRKTLGFRRDNSELYVNVIKAIDNYRLAPSVKKESYRRRLENACGEYVSNRKASKERTKMVFELGKFVHDKVKPQAVMMTRKGRLPVAEKMLDTYKKILEANENEASGKALQSLENETFSKLLIEEMTDTESCAKAAVKKISGYEYAKLSFKAVNEAAKQKPGFEVADAKFDLDSQEFEFPAELLPDPEDAMNESSLQAQRRNKTEKKEDTFQDILGMFF